MMDTLVASARPICLAIAVHLWQSTLVLAAVALLAWSARHAPPRLVSALWWTALLKLFLPLALLAPPAARVAAAFQAAMLGQGVSSKLGGVTVWLYPGVLGDAGNAGPGHGVAPWVILLALWAVGVAWLAAGRIRRACRDRPRVTRFDGTAAATLDAALRGTAIPRGSLLTVEGSGLPSVAGLLHPHIRVSRRLAELLDSAELRAILLHEDAHRRRRDPLRALPAELAAMLLFFYPPTWWLRRRLHELTEMICDEAALRAGIGAEDYSRSLARTLLAGLSPAGAATAIHGGPSPIRRRLERLACPRRNRTMMRHRLALGCAVAVVLSGSFLPFVPSPALQARAGTSGTTTVMRSFEMLDRLPDAERPISLTLEDVSIDDAISLLAKAGLRVKVHGPLPERPIVLRADSEPLAAVLRRLAVTAGLQYGVSADGVLEITPIAIGGVNGVTNPRVVTKVPPDYPESAAAERVEGNVILQVIIDERGDVVQIELLRAEPRRQDFIDAAIAALRQWHYEPAMKDGVAVPAYFTIFIEFTLSGGTADEAGPGKVA